MTCGARGQTYVVIAERREDTLRFVGNEMPRSGKAGPARMPGLLSGQYHIEANGWRCPLCQNADAIWFCDCERMKGAMHCHGSSRGVYRCACGRAEPREFVSVKHTEVRGASVAAMPEQKRSGVQHGQPQLKQVSHERTR
jgi:hypothetical protein